MNTDDPLDILRTRQADGQVVLGDRFRVLKKLGEGGMGAVWLAEDIKLNNRKVAVKMLPSVLAANSRAVGQLKQEALLAMQLSHPHIVTLRSFEETEDGAFLVMDYVEGRTLEQELEQSKALSEEQVRKLLGPVADALDYAHSKKVIHRDIKPSNILLQRSEATSALAESDERRWTDSTNNKQRTTNYSPTTAFITDFGVAREMKETFTRVTGRQTSGTLPYMAPEQLRGAAPGPAQDVYGFAATVYEAIAGHPPFHRGQIEYQIINEEAPRLERCSAALANNVAQALAKDPALRPARCADIWGEPVAAKENKGRRTGLAALARRFAAVVGVVAVVGLALYFKGSNKKPVQTSSGIPDPKATEEAKNRVARVPTGFNVLGADIDAASGLATTIEHEKTGYRLKLVPAGEFFLGSAAGEGNADEHPLRRIYLDAYWIGETEVTCEQYAKFLNEKGNLTVGGVAWCGLGGAVKIEHARGTYRAKPGLEQHPVVKVSWFGAKAFAQWMGGRLPTEAHWEKAAKGGRDVKWPWGNTWDKNKANTAERIAGADELKTYDEWLKWWKPLQKKKFGNSPDYSDTTVPVNSYRPNGYGLYNMAGNVWEWCEDYYAADAYQQLRDEQKNPPAVASGDMQTVEYWQGGEMKTDRQECRVVRGGGWNVLGSNCRCANRLRVRPANWGADGGLRVAVVPRP